MMLRIGSDLKTEVGSWKLEVRKKKDGCHFFGLRTSSFRLRFFCNKNSFTLIEVMVAVAVLSFGIVMLYQSFFICADSSHYASNLIFAKLWIDGKIGQEKETFGVSLSDAAGEDEGALVLGSRTFSWKKTLQPVDAGLYSLTVAVSWKEAGRQRSLSQSTYLIS